MKFSLWISQKARSAGLTYNGWLAVVAVFVVVVAVIGLFFPCFGCEREASRKVVAHNDETQIVAAIKAYYTEYGRYPVVIAPKSGSDSYFGSAATLPAGSSMAGTNDVLFDVLRNNTANPANAAAVATLNPRGIAFLDVPPVQNLEHPIAGIIPNAATPAPTSKAGIRYDPWGSQYNVLLDTNNDNTLNNPYPDAPGGATLKTGVIVWSNGKNGEPGGGSAMKSGFSNEPGTPGKYAGSGDVISWQ